MLHFRIHILLFAYGAIGSEGVSKLCFSFERAAMKNSILLILERWHLARFVPL